MAKVPELLVFFFALTIKTTFSVIPTWTKNGSKQESRRIETDKKQGTGPKSRAWVELVSGLEETAAKSLLQDDAGRGSATEGATYAGPTSGTDL